MAKKVLTIELGAWWTKVVLTEPYKRFPQILDLFYFRTPEHTVEDGFVRDRETFLAALQEELAARRITVRDVIFIINSTKVIIREVSIPFVKDRLLPSVVETQAKEFFPMDISNYTISFRKMEEYTEEEKKKLKLLLIAVPDNLLNNYRALAENGGFSVESYEYIGNAAVSFAKANYEGNSVLVQLDENETIISIIVNKKTVFQRVAPNGYGSTLATVLDHPVLGAQDESSAYYFLITHDVLFKRPRVVNSGSRADERKQAELDNAYTEIRDALSYHIRVVYTAIEYYLNQSKKEFHGVLRLVGDGARIAGLAKLFADEINLEVAPSDAISQVRLSKHISLEEASEVDFTAAIGAGISPLGIKPREQAAREAKKSNLKAAYVLFAGSAAASVALVATGWLRYSLAAAEADRLETRIGELSYVQQIYDENVAVTGRAAEYSSFDALTKNENERFLDLLAGLEACLPRTVQVQSLSVANGMITMSVTSPDKLTTAQMLMYFYDMPVLTNVAIPSMTEGTTPSGRIQWQYSVSAVYAPEDPEQTGQEAM